MTPETCQDDEKNARVRRFQPGKIMACRKFATSGFSFLLLCAILFLPATPAGADPVEQAVITAHVAPVLFGNITVGQVSPTGAHISWITTLPADSWVYYDTVSHPNTEDYAFFVGNDILTMTHLLALSNLKPGTLYYFRVRSNGPGGVSIISGEMVFKTLSIPPTGGGGGGGGGSYGIFVIMSPLPTPTPTPGPAQTPELTPLPSGPEKGTITTGNESLPGNVTPTLTQPGALVGKAGLTFIARYICFFITLVLAISAIILIFLYRRRRKDE